MMKALPGEDWMPLEMHGPFYLPKLADRLFDLFKVRVKMGQEKNQLVFSASNLNRKVSGSFGQFDKYLQVQLDVLTRIVQARQNPGQ